MGYTLQDNVPDYLRGGVAGLGLREWSRIRTADIRLSLEPGFVEGDGRDRQDELARWISFEDASFSGRTPLWTTISTGRIVHCDIEMNAVSVRDLRTE